MNRFLPRILVRGPSDRPRVALTFDDGPHPEITPRLLDVLAKHDARATFFLLGNRVSRWPECAARIAEEGHGIGSHGFAHRGDWWRSPTTLGADLDRAEEVFGSLLSEPKLFRPPFGGMSPSWMLAAGRRRYTCVFWSIASLDWRRSEPAWIVRRVTRMLRPGAVVLMHECRAQTGEGYAHTVEAVEQCLAYMKERGFGTVNVTEFLSDGGGSLK